MAFGSLRSRLPAPGSPALPDHASCRDGAVPVRGDGGSPAGFRDACNPAGPIRSGPSTRWRRRPDHPPRTRAQPRKPV